MIEYRDLVLKNKQYIDLCNETFNCNSFLFESSDEVFLKNFAYCFAQYIFCSEKNKPCGQCIQCQKVNLLSHADLKIYPLNNKNILVDDVKDLIETVNLMPIESDYKVFIFNNFSSANIQAQNKLLKILEEPPRNTFIILNVTNSSKVLPTVASRCKKIRLSLLDSEDIKANVKDAGVGDKDLDTIVEISQGSLQKVLNYTNNDEFINTFKNCLTTMRDMKDSRQLIKYSSLFNQNKQVFEMALEIFEVLFRDMLVIRLGKEGLVKNKNEIGTLKSISQDFHSDAIDLIIRRIYFIKKQMEFNCNYVLLVDNLLLYILEVKFLCNKK